MRLSVYSFIQFILASVLFVAFATAENAEGVTQLVFLDFEVGGDAYGRALVGLFGNNLPNTAARFAALAAGSNTDTNGDKLTYVGTPVTVDRNYLSCGIVNNYAAVAKEDYLLAPISHSAAGYISLIGDANGNVGSQFLITTAAIPSLDSQNSIVGKILEGHDIIDLVQNYNMGLSIRLVATGLVR